MTDTRLADAIAWYAQAIAAGGSPGEHVLVLLEAGKQVLAAQGADGEVSAAIQAYGEIARFQSENYGGTTTLSHAKGMAAALTAAALFRAREGMGAWASSVCRALETADWSGVSIGNKALISAAIKLIRATPQPRDPAPDPFMQAIAAGHYPLPDDPRARDPAPGRTPTEAERAFRAGWQAGAMAMREDCARFVFANGARLGSINLAEGVMRLPLPLPPGGRT